jgi:hypothetical protein
MARKTLSLNLLFLLLMIIHSHCISIRSPTYSLSSNTTDLDELEKEIGVKLSPEVFNNDPDFYDNLMNESKKAVDDAIKNATKTNFKQVYDTLNISEEEKKKTNNEKIQDQIFESFYRSNPKRLEEEKAKLKVERQVQRLEEEKQKRMLEKKKKEERKKKVEELKKTVTEELKNEDHNNILSNYQDADGRDFKIKIENAKKLTETFSSNREFGTENKFKENNKKLETPHKLSEMEFKDLEKRNAEYIQMMSSENSSNKEKEIQEIKPIIKEKKEIYNITVPDNHNKTTVIDTESLYKQEKDIENVIKNEEVIFQKDYGIIKPEEQDMEINSKARKLLKETIIKRNQLSNELKFEPEVITKNPLYEVGVVEKSFQPFMEAGELNNTIEENNSTSYEQTKSEKKMDFISEEELVPFNKVDDILEMKTQKHDQKEDLQPKSEQSNKSEKAIEEMEEKNGDDPDFANKIDMLEQMTKETDELFHSLITTTKEEQEESNKHNNFLQKEEKEQEIASTSLPISDIKKQGEEENGDNQVPKQETEDTILKLYEKLKEKVLKSTQEIGDTVLNNTNVASIQEEDRTNKVEEILHDEFSLWHDVKKKEMENNFIDILNSA